MIPKVGDVVVHEGTNCYRSRDLEGGGVVVDVFDEDHWVAVALNDGQIVLVEAPVLGIVRIITKEEALTHPNANVRSLADKLKWPSC